MFVDVSDPIGSGFIASLARPGGNLTGLLLYEASITGKWLAMLKEIAPRLARAALVANPKTTPYDYFLRRPRPLAPSLAIELVPSPIENARRHRARHRGLCARAERRPGPAAGYHYHRRIAISSSRSRPGTACRRFTRSVLFVAAGGLMSYGTDRVDQFRQAASYVDRILRGAKPADLPVQAPTKYETVINLKTAKALGLTVPPALLVAADEVIE